MRKMTVITLALSMLMMVSISDDANAGWFSKDKKEEANNKAHRFELFPSMKFFSGTLQRDTYAGWRLDELSLQLMGNGNVTMDGDEKGYLQEGRSAIIMGVQYGSTLVAYRIKVMKDEYAYGQQSSEENVVPGPNPNVGEGTGPQ